MSCLHLARPLPSLFLTYHDLWTSERDVVGLLDYGGNMAETQMLNQPLLFYGVIT